MVSKNKNLNPKTDSKDKVLNPKMVFEKQNPKPYHMFATSAGPPEGRGRGVET